MQKNKEICKEKTIEIIKAYKTIMDYCENYHFSFSKEEIEKYISAMNFGKKDLEMIQYGVIIIMMLDKVNIFDYLSNFIVLKP